MMDLARSWVDGWTVARQTPKPVDEPWGLSIQVGRPDETVRHILLGPDTEAGAETARDLIASVTEPTTCIKGFLEPAVMQPWFSPEWAPVDPCFLMAVDLHPSAVRPPDGYTATTETAGDLVTVRILTTDGAPAARGHIGLSGDTCVFDQIVTEKSHQRLGLGTTVMRSLTNAALDHGATTATLGATVQGRALYETLDWKVLAPLTGFIYRPAAP